MRTRGRRADVGVSSPRCCCCGAGKQARGARRVNLLRIAISLGGRGRAWGAAMVCVVVDSRGSIQVCRPQGEGQSVKAMPMSVPVPAWERRRPSDDHPCGHLGHHHNTAHRARATGKEQHPHTLSAQRHTQHSASRPTIPKYSPTPTQSSQIVPQSMSIPSIHAYVPRAEQARGTCHVAYMCPMESARGGLA